MVFYTADDHLNDNTRSRDERAEGTSKTQTPHRADGCVYLNFGATLASYRTSSIEKNDRRYDSDSSHRGGLYGDEVDERRSDSRVYNWRYDSIQEEDHVKENWRDEKALQDWEEPEGEDHDWRQGDQKTGATHEEEHYATEGYQADREDSSRQNSVERPEIHQTTDIAQ
ncbi:hypothetical protein TELCIR_18990 [Teladorsagia circumcincta]|uniref:Uncharacterized protein n=1 Tax=Teladorsagia circumcincta TaxID=45464 RepID=A0A2G9TNN8_TELCI|nr:hypothetical protein TELCIR_18990 [Teladorsagia circumcincta]